MNERSLDPQRTIDHEQANGQPETIDVTGAYQTASPTQPHTPALPADTPVIPAYRILHEIARGSMGRVLLRKVFRNSRRGRYVPSVKNCQNFK